MTINIAHLYPQQLNLYGDKGNIETLKRRIELRGIKCDVKEYSTDDIIDFENTDIILLGGGGEKEQKKVFEALTSQREQLAEYIEKGGCMLAICGGFEMLGKDFLNILNISAKDAKKRVADDIVIESDIISSTIVGFENHSKNIEIGDLKPLGKVIYGIGNHADGIYEGAIYKNLIGTNMYGPILPKNPHLSDYIIKSALKRKYNQEFSGELEKLDDEIELKAHEYIVKKCKEERK